MYNNVIIVNNGPAGLGWMMYHRVVDLKEIAVERPPGLAGSTAGSMFGQIPIRMITGFPHTPSPPSTLYELQGKIE